MLVSARLIHRSKWSPRWLGHTVRATRSTLISMPWMHYQGTAVTRTDVERGASSMPYWTRYAFPKHAYALHLSHQLWYVDVLQSREPAEPEASVGLSLRLHDLTITRNDWKATLANQVARVAGCMPSRQQQRAGQKKVLDKLAIQIPAGRMTAIMVRNW